MLIKFQMKFDEAKIVIIFKLKRNEGKIMILKELKIQTYIVEPTNCYIIFDEQSKETMCIDPTGEPKKIAEMIKDVLKGNLKYIYLTHCHGDHIGGVNGLKELCGENCKILIHRDDSEGLNDKNINLSGVIDMPEIELQADSRIDDNDLIHLGELEFRVIHTPGHTKGSSSLYCEKEKCLFSGDTMFSGTYGRTDLPTSSREQIIDSIISKLLVLPDDTIVYPGHGRPTRIGDERCNYILNY